MEKKIIEDAQRVLDLEADALINLKSLLDDQFVAVVKSILNCRGKLIFTGVGKAGIIAQKVSSTFSSLGRSSFFMHAAEASHGDLGMISPNDMIFLFSHSGGSKEVTSIIPTIKKIGSLTVAITGNQQSYLYQEVDHPLFYGKLTEACGFNLAPTTSTTAMLALGDALAISVLKHNVEFSERSFAFFHPGGSLGQQLLLNRDLMRKGNDVVTISPNHSVKEVLVKMTRARIGSAVIINDSGKSNNTTGQVLGVFSDGDLRRSLEASQKSNILEQPISKYMSEKPSTIQADQYVIDAKNLMTEKKIGELPVVDSNGTLIGVICLKDIN